MGDVATTAEVEQLRADLASAQAGLTKLRDANTRRHMLETQQAKRERAAMRRQLQSRIDGIADCYVSQSMRDALASLIALIHMADQLGDQASKAQVANLKRAAAIAAQDLRLSATRPSPSAVLISNLQSEISDLRSRVMRVGHEAHERHVANGLDTNPHGLGCECPGCLLIIEMDS